MVNHPYKWDVFVSHNRRQKPWVREMVRQLREHGLQVFFDEDDIPPGADVVGAIEQGIELSRYLVFVITPSSVASEWVSLEISISLHLDPSGETNRLIPLMLEITPETDIRPAVRRLNRIDLTDPLSWTDKYHTFLQHISVEGTLPAPPPWNPQAPRIIAQVDSQLNARRALRVPLTDIACLLYKESYNSPSFLIKPDGMPVLSHEKFLPAVPQLLSEIDRSLLWEKRSDIPSPHVERDMVGILRSQSPPPQIYDGLLYRFLGFDDEGQFRFCSGSYFGFLNTCDYLSFELAKTISENHFAYDILQEGDHNKYSQVVSFLRSNQNLIPLRSAADPLDFASRCTAFGTCALVIVKRTNRPPQMILNLRSLELTETPDLLHVIPAGTFQPNMHDDRFHDTEFSLTENLVREFAEELLDAEDLRKPKVEHLDPEDMYSERGKIFRQQVVRKNNYRLYYLGTVIDPVNLKPESLTVFMIHDGFLFNVGNSKLVMSWESGRVSIHEFTKEELNYLILKSNFVPTGKAHLMLVREHFNFLSSVLSEI